MKRIMISFLLILLVSSCNIAGNKQRTNPTPSGIQNTDKNPIVLAFMVEQGGSTSEGGVTRIGFIKRDCLEDVRACPQNILVLPKIAAKDMGSTVVWAPDGKKFMFLSDLSGNLDIYTENIDGTDRKNITNSPDREDCPVWSPDGGYVLYDRESTADENPQVQIWIEKSDGSGARFLVEGDCPAWSPDGKDILFTRQKIGNGGSGTVTSVLYTMHVSDITNSGTPGEPIPLTNGLTFVSGPAYSPDGKKIAYLEEKNNFNILKVMDADGKNIVAFTEIEGGAGYPAWSPDGSQLAFTVNKSHTSPSDIYILSVDTRMITRVTHAPELTSNGDPYWSPDGTMLAFSSLMDTGHFNLMVYRIAEKTLLKLTAASIDNEYQTPSWIPVQK